MKLKEIISRTIWIDVRKVLCHIYYKDDEYVELEGYRQIFENLKNMDSIDSGNMKIHIKKMNEGYVDIYGTNGTLNKDSDDFSVEYMTEEVLNSEVTYALEFTKWEKWLDMGIDSDVISEFSFPEIAAHCLYEMTFMGYNQEEIEGKADDLAKRCEDIKSGKAKTISFDEFKEKLGEDFEENDEEENN